MRMLARWQLSDGDLCWDTHMSRVFLVNRICELEFPIVIVAQRVLTVKVKTEIYFIEIEAKPFFFSPSSNPFWLHQNFPNHQRCWLSRKQQNFTRWGKKRDNVKEIVVFFVAFREKRKKNFKSYIIRYFYCALSLSNNNKKKKVFWLRRTEHWLEVLTF